jgi:hypothetical protein
MLRCSLPKVGRDTTREENTIMDLPIAQERMTAPMVSAGTTVEPIVKFDKEAAKDAPRVQDTDKASGYPLWRGYVFVPGEDGQRPEQIAVKLAMPVEPKMPAFGAVVEFENLMAVPYVVSGTGRVAVSFKATGIAPVVARGKDVA